MKNLAFIFIVICLYTSSCSNSDRSTNQKTYQQKIQDIETQEKRNPKRFIEIRGTYRNNLFGKTIIEGEIMNSATKARFKDIRIQVQFISKTKSVISTNNYILYDEVGPKERKPFKLKVKAPKPTESVSISVTDAK